MSFSATRWAWECECPSSTAKSVLIYLADCLNEGTGQCNPSLDRIKAYTQAGLAAVRKAISDLAEAGIVSLDRADGTYSFHLNFAFPKRIEPPKRRKQQDSRPPMHVEPPIESDRGVGTVESDGRGLSDSIVPPPVASDHSVLSHPIPEPRIEPRKGSLRPSPESPNLTLSPPDTTRAKSRARTVVPLTAEQEVWFGMFYAAYPRHRKREEARRAFKAALDRGITIDRIMAGVARNTFNNDPQYIPYPATWLNGGGYDDEADPAFDPVLAAVGLAPRRGAPQPTDPDDGYPVWRDSTLAVTFEDTTA